VSDERLQKFLASAGVASRRKAEELIAAGRVKVNERKVTELGTKIDPARDLVTVDGRLVSRDAARAYYLLYKPVGAVTTASDPQGRPTALDYVKGVKERVFPVGRLDFDAEGALILTDDGELANRLAHPRYGHRRIYLVKVKGDPAPEALLRMVAGVRLEDGPAQALEAKVHERVEKNVWIRVVVGEGRNHLVKRLCEAVGLSVQRLFRPEFGGVTVEGLRPGGFRPLTASEIRAMRIAVGLEAGKVSAAPPRMPLLPRAARRHGHGPPLPPGFVAPAEREDDAPERGSARDEVQDAPRAPPRGSNLGPSARDSGERARPPDERRPQRSERTGPPDARRPQRGERTGPPDARRPQRAERPGNEGRAQQRPAKAGGGPRRDATKGRGAAQRGGARGGEDARGGGRRGARGPRR
jgi:23S rRNA pseudouridine2605 synthase